MVGVLHFLLKINNTVIQMSLVVSNRLFGWNIVFLLNLLNDLDDPMQSGFVSSKLLAILRPAWMNQPTNFHRFGQRWRLYDGSKRYSPPLQIVSSHHNVPHPSFVWMVWTIGDRKSSCRLSQTQRQKLMGCYSWP